MKTIWRIKEAGAKCIALQFPEGLLMYSCIISDILCDFADVDDTIIMGDVTYGACCVDDFTAHEMGADFLVHYGHSCLVPVNVTKMPCMYVFVDIQMDFDHFLATVELNFKPEQKLVLAGTIQFTTSIQVLRILGALCLSLTTHNLSTLHCCNGSSANPSASGGHLSHSH